jgi:hypothetical protein
LRIGSQESEWWNRKETSSRWMTTRQLCWLYVMMGRFYPFLGRGSVNVPRYAQCQSIPALCVAGMDFNLSCFHNAAVIVTSCIGEDFGVLLLDVMFIVTPCSATTDFSEAGMLVVPFLQWTNRSTHYRPDHTEKEHCTHAQSSLLGFPETRDLQCWALFCNTKKLWNIHIGEQFLCFVHFCSVIIKTVV